MKSILNNSKTPKSVKIFQIGKLYQSIEDRYFIILYIGGSTADENNAIVMHNALKSKNPVGSLTYILNNVPFILFTGQLTIEN